MLGLNKIVLNATGDENAAVQVPDHESIFSFAFTWHFLSDESHTTMYIAPSIIATSDYTPQRAGVSH
jgi:hypothetical protein